MIENIFTVESARLRHREAPMLEERERYLSHLFNQGTSVHRVQIIASMLLHVIRLMELSSSQIVTRADIERGSQRFLVDPESHIRATAGRSSRSEFTQIAVNWMKFLHQLSVTNSELDPARAIAEEFAHFLRSDRHRPRLTIRTYCARVIHFLRWAFVRYTSLSMISVNDVDTFLENKRSAGFVPPTIASYQSAIHLDAVEEVGFGLKERAALFHSGADQRAFILGVWNRGTVVFEQNLVETALIIERTEGRFEALDRVVSIGELLLN
jgi:hypothetical protein